MRYENTNTEVGIGDRVLLTDRQSGEITKGLVVCDFDKWLSLHGHSYWLTQSETWGADGYLDRGVMIKHRGLCEHRSDLDDVELVKRQNVRNGKVIGKK